MNPCLVVQRLAIGSVPPTDGCTRRVNPPEVEAIRFVYGVGDEPTELPAGSCFRPVYSISIPVARLGGLDLDDIYEFDAALMLITLQERARQRRWAMRLEFDVIQTHESATSAELYVEAPTGVSMTLLGHTGYGMPNPGGGRTLKIATGLVHTPEGVLRLAGPYQLLFRDVDPRFSGFVGVESPVQLLKIGLSEYEFES
ncbi:MAG: hypothetical protein KC420_06590 [Myxococcales bacterium]|nr:hypothetical protein [Myxococcales bacterium]MCB9706594.1 hypothetical protein [Myxococcales bacterium]